MRGCIIYHNGEKKIKLGVQWRKMHFCYTIMKDVLLIANSDPNRGFDNQVWSTEVSYLDVYAWDFFL